MKHNKRIVFCGGYLILVLTLLLALCPQAAAAETSQDWRSIFDLVMRWLNFAIIVFFLVKFGRKPIKDFLSNRREEIDNRIRKFEQQKNAAEQKVKEATEMLEDRAARFEEIKRRIIEDGEKKKQQIIEDARQESRILLEATQRKIQNQIIEARNLIRSELVESAVMLAEERLPAEITAADEQKLIENFIDTTAGK